MLSEAGFGGRKNLTPLGKSLRAYRISKGLFLGHMSEAMGLSASGLCAIEFGDVPMPEGFVAKLAALYPDFEHKENWSL